MKTYNPPQETREASLGFYNKVFTFFGLALLTSGFGVFLGFNYLTAYMTQPMMFAIWGVELALLFTAKWWSKKEPLAYGLFVLFALLTGVSLVPLLAYAIVSFNGYDLIYRALFATTGVFLAMAILGNALKRPFVGLGNLLFGVLLSLIAVGVMGIFFPWGNTFELIFSGIGVAVMAVYAMVHVSRLSYYPEDRYLMAAMTLYIDIFNLFVFMLRLLIALNRD